MVLNRFRFIGLCSMILGLVFNFEASALGAPKSELWERWTKHDATSTVEVDHRVWGSFLTKHLIAGKDNISRIAYGKVGAAERGKLASYITGLEKTDVDKLPRPEQQAFWINLYNALTIKVVLDHYPVDSIQDIDISPGFFASGPWGKKLLSINAIPISLNDIEHRILRPIWRDPRIHYAVNCASIGCPNLAPEPFVAEKMDQQLDRAAKAFVGHKRAVWFDGETLGASSIFKWFSEDFGDDDQEIIDHFVKYAPASLKVQLKKFTSINTYHYDWDLNDAK